MADEADDRAIKTVKGISAAAWERGLKAAGRRGEAMGAWLARAIERQAETESGDRVILPDERPAPVSLPASAVPVLPAADLTEMMRAAHAVSLAAGVPVPKTAARHLFAILTAQARQARGLGPVKPRQTRPRITADRAGG